MVDSVMKVVIDDKIPFIKGLLEPFAQVSYLPGKSISPDTIRDVDALVIRTRTRCNEALLKGSAVKAIFTATIGYDHIDTSYCEANGIHWQSAPGCNSSSVQQYIASVLASLHFDGHIYIPSTTIAVVGVGNVGSRVVDWCRRLGMKVLMVDPIRARREGTSDFVSLNEALSLADVVTFHTPLNTQGEDSTYHLFNEASLRCLKPGAVLINTSRGEVCDTQSILKGLDSGTISHAVIDVWENEPNVNLELLSRAYIATPHVAGYSYDSKRNGTVMAVRALAEFFRLPLTKFASEDLPLPVSRTVYVNNSCDDVSAACYMFQRTYNVMLDSTFYKSNPSEFEQYRGDYPLRREIGAYELDSACVQVEYLRQFGIQCPKR